MTGGSDAGGGDTRKRREPRPFTPKRAWDYLLFILARRSYTVAELRERLARRGLPDEEAEPLLDRLVELRLVDDAAYTEQYVHSRKESRGRLVLRRELRRKGVDEELVEQELTELTPGQQVEAATALLERNAWRYRPTDEASGAGADGYGEGDAGADAGAEPETYEAAFARRQRLHKARAKAFGFLARRGFGADAAGEALARVGWFDDDD